MISARSRLVIRLVLAIGLLSRAAQSEEPTPEQASNYPKVEFGEVDGFTCLQPVVKLPGAELEDFRAAARRWQSMVYPESRAQREEFAVRIPADAPGNGEAQDVTVERETVFVQKADGSTIKVCFDIGVKESRRDPRD